MYIWNKTKKTNRITSEPYNSGLLSWGSWLRSREYRRNRNFIGVFRIGIFTFINARKEGTKLERSFWRKEILWRMTRKVHDNKRRWRFVPLVRPSPVNYYTVGLVKKRRNIWKERNYNIFKPYSHWIISWRSRQTLFIEDDVDNRCWHRWQSRLSRFTKGRRSTTCRQRTWHTNENKNHARLGKCRAGAANYYLLYAACKTHDF